MKVITSIFSVILLISLFSCHNSGSGELPREYVRISSAIDSIESQSEQYRNFDRSVSELNTLLQDSKQQGYDKLTARINQFISHFLEEEHQLAKAYVAGLDALKYWEQSDSVSNTTLYAIHHHLGSIANKVEAYEKAIFHLNQALSFLDGSSPAEKADTYYEMGLAYLDASTVDNHLQLAEETWLTALSLSEATSDHENVARIQVRLGLLYKELKALDKSIAAFHSSSTVANEHSFKTYSEKANYYLAELYFERGQLNQAESYANKGVEYTHDSLHTFYAYRLLGDISFSRNEYDAAILRYEQAIALLNGIGDISATRYRLSAYGKLSKAYSEAGRTNEAFAMLQQQNEETKELLTVRAERINSSDALLFAEVLREYEEFHRKEQFRIHLWEIYVPLGIGVLSLIFGLLAFLKYRARLRKEQVMEDISSFRVESLYDPTRSHELF